MSLATFYQTSLQKVERRKTFQISKGTTWPPNNLHVMEVPRIHCHKYAGSTQPAELSRRTHFSISCDACEGENSNGKSGRHLQEFGAEVAIPLLAILLLSILRASKARSLAILLFLQSDPSGYSLYFFIESFRKNILAIFVLLVKK